MNLFCHHLVDVSGAILIIPVFPLKVFYYLMSFSIGSVHTLCYCSAMRCYYCGHVVWCVNVALYFNMCRCCRMRQLCSDQSPSWVTWDGSTLITFKSHYTDRTAITEYKNTSEVTLIQNVLHLQPTFAHKDLTEILVR